MLQGCILGSHPECTVITTACCLFHIAVLAGLLEPRLKRPFSCFRELRSAVSVERVWKDVFSFPRGVGAWSLAARQEARQGRIPPIAQSLPKANQRNDTV